MAVSGVLKVLIVGADNLDRIVTAGQQQPYYILECGSQRSRSKPCLESGTNPTWNTAHKFNVADEAAVLAVIKDEVTKGIIGQGIIDLPRAKQYGKDEGAVVLMNLGGNPAGTLRFKLKYAPPQGSSTPPAAATAGAVLGAHSRSSDAGSHTSLGRHTPSPHPSHATATAAALHLDDSAVDDDDSADPMLAAVTSKVSLAKQAMRQLTAELAELTGADTATTTATGKGSAAAAAAQSELPSPFISQQQQRQPPKHTQSLRERERERDSRSGAASAGLQQQQQFRSFRQPPVSPGSAASSAASVSPSAAAARTTALAPSAAAGSTYPYLDRSDLLHAAQQPHEQQELAGWHASWRSVSGGGGGMPPPAADLSPDELLALYAGEAAVGSSGLALVRQLQQALAAAHAEKVATDDELGTVKQAMAVMSKQHYLDVKRLRDAAGSAGTATHSSPKGIKQMVDTHPPKAHGRGPRVSNDSSASQEQQLHIQQQPGGGEDGSPVPAYKMQIQIHQLERQLVEQAAKTQQEVDKREAGAAQLSALQAKFDAQVAATKQAEANAKAAEAKAAQQATLAAAARAEVAAARESNSRDAQLESEVAEMRAELAAIAAEKGELEEALGLMEKNNSAQVAALQAELQQLRAEAASLRLGSDEASGLREQLAAARAEASGLRNNNEDVEYLQTQLRRTLRDNVELRHKLQMLQQSANQNQENGDAQEAEDHAAILSEHEALMQELVNTKLELAELKEQQVRMQRQLYKAQTGLHNSQI